jgi:hemerythrin superfamily protein
LDAITLLKNDHKTVEKLFKAFEKAGPRAKQTKAKAVAQIIEELSVHAAIEEQVFYPSVRAEVEDTDSEILESLEEHHIVKWELAELEDLSPDDERFDAKVTVLIENVRHHVQEEEGELFPEVRSALGRKRLSEIGDSLETAKKAAPRRPHPRASDTPPANLVSGAVAGVADRVRQASERAFAG